MARLISCPACDRHVRATEPACPFCGHAGLTTTAPGRLSIALLSLGFAACLTHCTKGAPEVAPEGGEAAEQPELTPEPETPVETPTPAPAPAPAPDTTGGAADTTGADETGGAGDSEGTDDGAAISDEPPPEIREHHKTKYGGPPRPPEPRPHKKYGAPPPMDDPFGGP